MRLDIALCCVLSEFVAGARVCILLDGQRFRRSQLEDTNNSHSDNLQAIVTTLSSNVHYHKAFQNHYFLPASLSTGRNNQNAPTL
jgi:hypothetical protein